MDTTNKILEKIVYVKEKQKFMLRRETRTFYYDPIAQHRLSKNPIKVTEEFLPLSCLGDREPKKEVTVQIMLKKSNVNTETLETMTAYFSQSLKVSVLSDSTYIYQYVTVDNFRVFIHNLDSGQTCPMALSSEQVGLKKEFLGVPKRITETQAQALMDSGISVYEKFQGEYRILI
jgi:hypothetical protein